MIRAHIRRVSAKMIPVLALGLCVAGCFPSPVIIRSFHLQGGSSSSIASVAIAGEIAGREDGDAYRRASRDLRERMEASGVRVVGETQTLASLSAQGIQLGDVVQRIAESGVSSPNALAPVREALGTTAVLWIRVVLPGEPRPPALLGPPGMADGGVRIQSVILSLETGDILWVGRADHSLQAASPEVLATLYQEVFSDAPF